MITIITPTLNCSYVVERCIDGDDKQGIEFRHLFVDGGSTDETISILSKRGCEVISIPGSTIYSAMNIGISESKTEWLYFIGSDDYLLPFALDKIADKLSSTDKLVCRVPISIDGRTARHSFRQQGIIYRNEVFKRFGCFDETAGLYADRVYFDVALKNIPSLRIDVPMTFVSLSGITGTNMRRQ